MRDYEETHQKWLKDLIDKKVSFLGKDEYVSYFNIFINNEVVQIAYDGKFICSAIYLCRNLQCNGETLIYDDDWKVRTTKVSMKKINQIRDFIGKYIAQNSVDQQNSGKVKENK
jgi:hypothetical protein